MDFLEVSQDLEVSSLCRVDRQDVYSARAFIGAEPDYAGRPGVQVKRDREPQLSAARQLRLTQCAALMGSIGDLRFEETLERFCTLWLGYQKARLVVDPNGCFATPLL